SANTSVTVSQAGTYSYDWHEVNGTGCEDRDTVVITFIQQPVAEAGQNISLCQLSATLAAVSTVGLGTWTQVSGPGSISFDNNHNPNAIATATQQGTYVLQWTENNQGCTSLDQVTLVLTQQPVANAGVDTALCSFNHTFNAIPSVGVGTWLMISGPGTATFSNVHSPTSSVNVSTHGTYTFLWNEDNNNGCISNDTVLITFNYIPISTFTLPSILCFNDTIVVTYTGNATPQATYTWNFGNATVISGTGAGPYAITYNQPGNYTVSLQISQNNCTSSTTTMQITNPEPISLSLSKVDITCFGYNDGLVTSQVTGGTPPYNYHWNNGSIFANQTQATAGWYFLTVTDQNSCKATADITVLEPAQLTIEMIDSMAICKDSTITISASATGGTFPYSYQWNNGANANSITVTPTTTTIYSLIVKDSRQCMAQKSIKVYVYPPLNFTATANPDSICLGEKVTINTVTSGGMGAPYTYYVNGLWSSSPIYLYPNNSQSYQIRVKDGCNYTAMVDVPIFVYPSPSINPSSNIISGCVPLTVQFNESSPDEGQTYLWDFGDNSSAFSRNPKHTFNNAGTYTISLTVTTVNGCHVTNIFPNWITVYPLPNAQFIATPPIANVVKPEIVFSNYSTLADSVMWFFGDGDSTNIYNPYHIYPADTPRTYQVTLVVFTNKGCSDTVYGTVQVRDVYTFYAPTAFSPDGDGINEVFYVSGHGIKEETFKLTIYDRWGEIVFETNDIHEGWDGRIKGGKLAPIGTYTWLAKFKDVQKIAHDEYGKVTIIR
ncbi:MAG: gliding motility-associated C-terminal domain-containing protein, partial [Bacteroidales bacterium]|nr:gliding motility-associated C-terminal domain-containing protein [Bacteroidales bacterium]